ncbi:MAG: 4-hydroxy-tetrahydrodipicolinate synthase [Pseudomonadota bacterium]
MFQGSMVALVTPMHSDGAIDYGTLEKLVKFHIDNGTDAIVSMGTTGESATVGFEEHAEVVRQTVAFADGKVPVIAGTGANATSEAMHLTKSAKAAGADACLLVTPYYNKPSQEGLYQHFKKIATEVDIPQLLYNVPGRTAIDMLPDTVERLADIDNIVGIKEATGDLARARELLDRVGDRMVLITGDDATAMEFMLLGGKGDISVTANVAPAQMHAMCEAAINGDRARAQELDAPLRGLHSTLFLEANPIPVKWALAEMGMIGPALRLPMTELNETYHEEVREALRAAGVLS